MPVPKKPNFAATLKRTRGELERLRQRRATLDAEIEKLEQIEIALRGVAEPRKKSADLSSLTDVVRTALRSAELPLPPTQLRDQVLAMGFDKRRYTQFLASLHVVLKRLVANGEVWEFSFGDGKRYWWVMKSMPGGPWPENSMLGDYLNSRRPSNLITPLSYDEAKAKEKAKYRR